MAGIIAGENIGVAPGVELMVAAVLESETLKTSLERGGGPGLAVIAVPVRGEPGKAVIVNMSLGFSKTTLSRKEYADAVTGLRSVIDTLVTDFDVLPITAVGNEGRGKVRAPAYFPYTISVGAVDYALGVAGFSGSGTSPITGETEPEPDGYGVDVTSSYERDRYNRSHYRALRATVWPPLRYWHRRPVRRRRSLAAGRALGQADADHCRSTEQAAGRAGNGLARFVRRGTVMKSNGTGPRRANMRDFVVEVERPASAERQLYSMPNVIAGYVPTPKRIVRIGNLARDRGSVQRSGRHACRNRVQPHFVECTPNVAAKLVRAPGVVDAAGR